MEALSLLEKKIVSLLDLINKLKVENTELKSENDKLTKDNIKLLQSVKDLTEKLEAIEKSVFDSSKDLDELSQEKELTKIVVDDLIKNIDSFVKEENQ